MELTGGCEWVIEAHGCDPSVLRDPLALQALFDSIVSAMRLHPIGAAAWHRFPAPGGVTGLSMLSESHLACHTFPEFRSLCLNLFCCRVRPDCDFGALLERHVGAAAVQVRRIDRPYQG